MVFMGANRERHSDTDLADDMHRGHLRPLGMLNTHTLHRVSQPYGLFKTRPALCLSNAFQILCILASVCSADLF